MSPTSTARSPNASEDIAESREDAERHSRWLQRRSATKPRAGSAVYRECAGITRTLVSMKIQDAASKYSWLLIPLSVPFMWLLFPFRRRYNTYDHTVFVTYSLSFMMMLVIVGGVLVAARHDDAGQPAVLRAAVPHVPALKQSYELGRFSAIMRTMALVTFAFIAAGAVPRDRGRDRRRRLGAGGCGSADSAGLGPLRLRDRRAGCRDRGTLGCRRDRCFRRR